MTAEAARNTSFDRIRYAQCWEDADVLLTALDVHDGGIYLSIASAGDNALALLGQGARRVIAVDLSPAQIACLELRVAAYRCLSHRELLELLGQNDCEDRGRLYLRCRPSLSTSVARFWDERRNLIDRGFARIGRFERFLSAFRRFVLPLVHSRGTAKRLLELESISERQAWYDERWNTRRWNWLARLCFGRESLGRFGRDRSFTRFADEPVWESLKRRIPQALVVQQPADNPYLQWILTGRFATALPYALRPENFDAIRNNLDALEWHCRPIEDLLGSLPTASIDGFNLSDIFEYVSEDGYHRLLDEIARVGAPGARLVYWNVVVERQRPPSMRDRLTSHRELARVLHDHDKAFFYRRLVIEEVL